MDSLKLSSQLGKPVPITTLSLLGARDTGHTGTVVKILDMATGLLKVRAGYPSELPPSLIHHIRTL